MDSAVWAVMGGLLLLAEFGFPEFILVFFGLGALLNALVIALSPHLQGAYHLQIILWAATSCLSLLALRRYLSAWFCGAPGEPQPGPFEEDLGATAETIEPISPEHPGRIRFRGTSWQAISAGEAIPRGTTVTILGRDNVTYLVTPEEEHEPTLKEQDPHSSAEGGGDHPPN
ncbi:Membrane protein implicated in regulation of membrane protease activity [Alkalispirochaeta americana]|uniref:Membrane protein implicated in regulation of membrane protease activity n=1 Tax=Alkalispirochaeta americana TaxID=159291 RepID=A0A1N6QA69_9SPIO|nr:NfeD family protein [Alkalispirochaeta americana]SIQ13477.1 Membrane protein implicated in regulation of membrane protease activity [Alkalispirochaeta americana]